VRGRVRLAAPFLVVVALLLEGCSVFALPPAPSWVPLVGRPEQGKAPNAPPVPAAKQPTAPLISVGQAAPVDPDTALANVAVSPRLTAIVKDFKPAVILISGCQDNQFSMDGDHNGAFTGQLLRVWNDGRFKGNHARLHALVRAGLPATQSPNLFTLGPAAEFLQQTPFTI